MLTYNASPTEVRSTYNIQTNVLLDTVYATWYVHNNISNKFMLMNKLISTAISNSFLLDNFVSLFNIVKIIIP